MKQKKTCDVEGFTDSWIETREHVNTVTYDAWWAAGADAALTPAERNVESLSVALQIIGAWQLQTEAEPVPPPSEATPVILRERLDVRLLIWIIKAVSEMLNERVNLKNANSSKLPASP